jgi:hypothetical protein
MKKSVFIIVIFLFYAFISVAQQGKMPITSSSGNAVELYQKQNPDAGT